MSSTIGYTYDDKLLIPSYSEIKSRSEYTDTQSELFKDVCFDIPVIPANMNMITEHKMIISMLSLGGTAALHRFMSPDDVANQISSIIQDGFVGNGINVVKKFGISIGVDKKYYNLVFSELDKKDLLNSVGYVIVDVAHGDHVLVKEALKDIRSNFEFPIIAGNICTPEAAMRLVEWGASTLKAGVGPGGICTTRIKIGVGYPQLSAVHNIYKCLVKNNIKDVRLIADGGIKQEGDIVKALAAGADFVMVGGMVAGTDDTPGNVITMHGKKYKIYEGLASLDAQINFFNKSSDDVAPEGEATRVEYKGKDSLKKTIKRIKKYIQTGLSYTGCRNLKELKEFGLDDKNWIVQTSAGIIEGTPHGT